MPEKTLYYVCFIAISGRVNPRWSAPLVSAAEARQEAKRLLASGEANLCFPVEIGPGGRKVLVERIEPAAARKAIEHFLALDESLEAEEEKDRERRGGPTAK